MPEAIKKLRDKTVEKLGFTPSRPQAGYNLITSMTDALFAEGHSKGVKDTLELFKTAFATDPKAKKMFDVILSAFEAREKDSEETAEKALDNLEDKLKN